MIKILRATAIFTFATTFSLYAQQKTTDHETQQWLQYYNQTKLHKHWFLLTDASFRWKAGFSEASQLLLRTGLGYALKQNLRVGAGFAYTGAYLQNHLSKVEYRPYQELLYKSNLNTININQRFRIEERFFSTVENHIHTFNFRFRYSVSMGITLFKLAKNKPETLFALIVGDEIFINAGQDIVHNMFDQNRFTISPTFQLNKTLSIAPTWNNQYAATSTPGHYKHTQVFWLQIRHNLDIGKN